MGFLESLFKGVTAFKGAMDFLKALESFQWDDARIHKETDEIETKVFGIIDGYFEGLSKNYENNENCEHNESRIEAHNYCSRLLKAKISLIISEYISAVKSSGIRAVRSISEDDVYTLFRELLCKRIGGIVEEELGGGRQKDPQRLNCEKEIDDKIENLNGQIQDLNENINKTTEYIADNYGDIATLDYITYLLETV